MTDLAKRDVSEYKQLRPGEYAKAFGPETWIYFKCPSCGFLTTLGKKNHTVAYDGSVTPRVNCPHKTGSGRKCEFMDFINLENWIPESKGNA